MDDRSLTLDVSILGREYRVACKESEREELLQAVQFLDHRMREIRGEAERARSDLVALADRDATAFDGVMEAFRMPKDTEEQKAARAAAIQRGYLAAAQVPLEIARASGSLMPLALETVERGNVNAASGLISNRPFIRNR